MIETYEAAVVGPHLASKIPEMPDFDSKVLNSIYALDEELNFLIRRINTEKFSKSVFEYNERFLLSCLNNCLIRHTRYTQIATLMEPVIYDDKRSIGRADMIIDLNDGMNEVQLIVEAKKWTTTRHYSDKEWLEFFALDKEKQEDKNELQLAKEQLAKYKADTWLINKSKTQLDLIIIFDHIQGEKSNAIVKEYHNKLDAQLSEDPLFYYIMKNTLSNDYLALYGLFV